jgi:hypothetical protein
LALPVRKPQIASTLCTTTPKTARELNLTALNGYAASDVLQEPNEAQSFTAGPISHEFDRLGDSSDDGRYETPSHADGLPQSLSASYEHERHNGIPMQKICR